jgi:tRNA threonylcarbamoyladenosine biosynthesis protein TsaB
VAEASPGMSHAAQLTVIIQKLLDESRMKATDLDAIAVSKGPGSYTGLRIGVSTAKGIAYAAQIPLLGINTLTSMCYGYLTLHPETISSEILLCPMIDARRMEVYNALFTADGTMVKETTADIIDQNSLRKELEKKKIIFFGNGAEKCKSIIIHPNALFEDHFILSASYLQIPSVNAMKNKHYEDLAYFEPYYLKEFIATTPRKLLL